MNETMSSFINSWLGTISHLQITVVCYLIAAFVLLLTIIFTYISGKNLKKQIDKIEAAEQAVKTKKLGS